MDVLINKEKAHGWPWLWWFYHFKLLMCGL